MPTGTRTDVDKQLKVLALFARGDTADQVSTQLDIPLATVNNIKRRNKDGLELMKSKLVDYEVTKSRKILDKAHGLIERKLDKAARNHDEREQAEAEYRAELISREEYHRRTYGLADATLAELNSVAKEAFNQSQIEQGKPTSISSSPQEAKEDLLRLVEALKTGDEEKMLKLMFDREVIEGEVVDEADDVK